MAMASLSLDLDNKWSYMKTHGDQGWASFPSYLDVAVPRILDFLDKKGLTITFFVVGQDAAIEANRGTLRSIADHGHEIGNHSFNHEPWLHLYSEERLDEELERAEDAIEAATGVRPRGFRGPGYSLSEATLKVLKRRGYAYDATVFPNLLNPLARAYLFRNSNLSEDEKEQRKALFGTLRDAMRPVKPFRWDLESDRLLEVPVTTMPVFKVPMHLSYVLYLSRFSTGLAKLYFRVALSMCRITATEPSILLHPLDFLGADDAKELAFFPGMNIPLEAKLSLVGEILDLLASGYRIVSMQEHVEAIGQRQGLAALQPSFPT